MDDLRSSAAALALATWMSGCAIVTPVDAIQMDAPQTDSGLDASIDATTGAALGSDAGGGDVPSCVVPQGADCNPIERCGCAAGTECDLDLAQGRVRCVPKKTGSRREGEHCAEPSDCASGLQCNNERLCARYCESDADCFSRGRCLEYRALDTMLRIPGSGTCSRWCDPLTSAECLPDTACYPAGIEDQDPSATCRAFFEEERKPAGAPCERYNECEARLACAEVGPRVCTSFCRYSSDCPARAPQCYTDFQIPLYADQVIGQCVVWPCEDLTLDDPPAWTGGRVWTADQHAECIRRCGPESPDCARENCPDGPRWRKCRDTVLAACAGAKGAPCRSQYVTLSCSEVLLRTIPGYAFDDCAESLPDCMALAEQTCAEPL